jgi:hypothetical protein
MRSIFRIALALALVGLAARARADAPPFRVGPGGTHATIQAAIDDAIAAGGTRDIQVAVGRRTESLRIVPPLTSRLTGLRLLGGWDEGFSVRRTDPALTVVDAAGHGRVLRVSWRLDGPLVVDGLTLTGGLEEFGAGVDLTVQGHGGVTFSNDRIVGNRVRGDVAQGAGLQGSVFGGGWLRMLGNVVEGNSIETGRYAFGGGAWLLAGDTSRIELRDNRFADNQAQVAADEPTNGDGLWLFVADSASLVMDHNVLERNRSLSPRGGTALDLGSEDQVEGARSLVATRNRVVDNVGGERPLVKLNVGPSTPFTLTDSVVAGGHGPGVHSSVSDGGVLYATNLTITRNAGIAFVADDLGGQTFVSNSILFGNGTDDAWSAVESHNLREDPSFVDPLWDFHLRPGSPAIDAGDDVPAGGLGANDIDGDRRRRGLRVDIGADETAGPGEPACSVLPFVGQSAPICRCVSEPDLRATRCGALLDDLLVSVRIPIDRDPALPLPVRWTLLPVLPVSGAYAMSAEALVGNQWEPQQWQGPAAPSLKDGQPVMEAFVWKLPGKATPVRTRLEYFRPGAAKASEVTLEVTLPDPPK